MVAVTRAEEGLILSSGVRDKEIVSATGRAWVVMPEVVQSLAREE